MRRRHLRRKVKKPSENPVAKLKSNFAQQIRKCQCKAAQQTLGRLKKTKTASNSFKALNDQYIMACEVVGLGCSRADKGGQR